MRPSFSVSIAILYPQLVFLFADGESGRIFLDQKRRDPLVALRRIHGGKQNEQPRLFAIRDPELASVENELIAFEFGLGLQRKRVRSRSRFAQRIGAKHVRRQPRQVTLLLVFIGPAQNRIPEQRVLHVHDYSGGSVGPRQFFDGQDRLKKLAARSTVLLRNLDAHQAELKELVDQAVIEHRLFVHLFRQRTNLVAGKLAAVFAEQNLVFGESGDRRGSGELQSFRHEDTSDLETRLAASGQDGEPEIVAGEGGEAATARLVRGIGNRISGD